MNCHRVFPGQALKKHELPPGFPLRSYRHEKAGDGLKAAVPRLSRNVFTRTAGTCSASTRRGNPATKKRSALWMHWSKEIAGRRVNSRPCSGGAA